jgi:hypothetical protein
MRISSCSLLLLTSAALLGCPSDSATTPPGGSSGAADGSSDSSADSSGAGDSTSGGESSSGGSASVEAECPDYAALSLDALLVAGPGEVIVDGQARPVVDVEFGEVDGGFSIIAVLDDDTFVGIPIDPDEEEPLGTVWMIDGNTTYTGEADATYDESTDAIGVGAATVSAGDDSVELSTCFYLGAGSSRFEVDGSEVRLSGALGSLTFTQIERLQAEHPEVQTLVLTDVPGSINDEVNVETGRLVRNGGWSTHLPADGEIASGAVDLFCAGVERTMESGGRIGVHSWANGTVEGADLPEDSPEHDFFIEYLQEMLGTPLGRDFYFFTLQAAPAADIHWMTAEEIEQYGLLTR